VKLLGWTITRRKANEKALAPVNDRGGWYSLIRESFAGAWQRNIETRVESVLTYSAVFACVTLIANDIAKLRLRLVRQDADGIWQESESSAFSPVLRRPNRYQNRIQFISNWVTSKLCHGNAYILKERDQRGIVTALYILDPNRVRPLVADDGAVYYDLWRDNLSNLPDDRLVVPAKEIIHDVMVPLYHPLCGVSPIAACGLPATQGLAIQNNSTRFFQNGGRPGGL
jgi:HK97 family phage portal protein